MVVHQSTSTRNTLCRGLAAALFVSRLGVAQDVAACAADAVGGAADGACTRVGKDEGEEEHGWRAPPGGYVEVDSEPCDIPRIAASSLTAAEFAERYFDKRPVVLTGVLGEEERARWSREVLLSKHGDETVQVGTSAAFQQKQGRGYQSTKLAAFLHQMRSPAAEQLPRNGSLGRSYIFDKGGLLTRTKETLADVQGLFPEFLHRQFFHDTDHHVLFLGPHSTGSQFHWHPSAFNILLHGRKRWLLYEPDSLPPFSYPVFIPIDLWLADVLPRVPEGRRPLQCIQRPGELMYVPELMYHATYNIGESVGVGRKIESVSKQGNFIHTFYLNRNAKAPGKSLKALYEIDAFRLERGLPSLPQVQKMRAELLMEASAQGGQAQSQEDAEKRAKLHKAAVAAINKLLATVPDSSEAHLHLANLESKQPQGSMQVVIDHLRSAIRLWPYCPTSHDTLSQMLVSMAQQMYVGGDTNADAQTALYREAAASARARVLFRQYHSKTRRLELEEVSSQQAPGAAGASRGVGL